MMKGVAGFRAHDVVGELALSGELAGAGYVVVFFRGR